MKNYKGKNVDEAITKGLQELNIKREHADIKVIDEGQTGVFGLFAREAEVSIRPLTEEEIKKVEQKKFLEKIFLPIGIAVAFLMMLLSVLIQDGKQESNQTAASSHVSHSQKESNSSSSSSSSSLSTSKSISAQTSNSSSAPSSSAPSIITIENDPEFAALLQTTSPDDISSFVEKHRGDIIEFDGHIANIAPSNGRRTYLDILLYAWNYQGPDQAVPGPNFKFNEIQPMTDSAFKPFNGEDIRQGQNVHIKARIGGFNQQQELLNITPIEIQPR